MNEVSITFVQFKDILQQLDNNKDYEAMYEQTKIALSHNPESINLLYFHGYAQMHTNKVVEAKETLSKAVNLCKKKNITINEELLYAYQTALLKVDGYGHDAHLFYKHACREPKNYAKIIAYGLSTIRMAEARQGAISKETFEAIERVEFCINHHTHENPDIVAGIYNILGMLYKETGNYQKAEEQYLKAIEFLPTKHDPQHNYGHLLLLKGDYQAAWERLEYRIKTAQFIGQVMDIDAPFWKGESLENKYLHIQAEQGIGDEIFYSCLFQYLPLHALKKISVGCDRRLVSILRPLLHLVDCEFINRHDKKTINQLKPDYQIMMGSLPYVLRLFHDQQPIPPCLRGDPEKKEMFRTILQKESAGKKTIAFAWRTMGKHTQRRNIKLQEIQEFLCFEDYFFVPVQYLLQKEDKEVLDNMHVDHYIADIDFKSDFDSLAALISVCDGVATADINIVHLAGALGKKTALFLPEHPNMRWSCPEKQKSLWYPTVHFINKDGDSWKNAAREAIAFFRF